MACRKKFFASSPAISRDGNHAVLPVSFQVPVPQQHCCFSKMTSQPRSDVETPVSANYLPTLDESPVLPPAFRGSLVAQDVIIPTHLLQAAGTVGSIRDAGETPNWQPQRQLTVKEHPTWKRTPGDTTSRLPRPDAIQRASTAPSGRPTPAASRAAIRSGRSRNTSNEEEKPRKEKRSSLLASTAPRRSWRLSFTPGLPERLTASPRSPRSPEPEAQEFGQWIAQHDSHDFAVQALGNPFENSSYNMSRSSSSRSSEYPFLTRQNPFSSNTAVHDGTERSNSRTNEPERAYVTEEGRQRRVTMEAIADAIVPDALQKKMTTASYSGLTRSSSMRDTVRF